MSRKEKFDYITIVIPAYNESKNLRILIAKIFKKYPAIKVVVVDDSDKAEDLRLRKILSIFGGNVKVISRFKKMGRGSAVIEGLKLSLKNKKVKIFIEMDADLAHDPDELSLFLQEIKSSDMVVGSRYRPKSKIIKWPVARLIQSRIINLFLRVWLGLNLTDYTNGYRAYSRRAAEFLLKQKLREKGFISLSETAFKLREAGFKISEVAITFRDRKFGRSSANLKELIASLRGAIRIRFSGRRKHVGIISQPLFYGLVSLLFIYLNYSFRVWAILNDSYGLAAAKVIPEVTGIVFFLILSKIYLSRFYPKFKIEITKRDVFVFLFLTVTGLFFHFKQFYTYFWKDDFYYFLNRFGTSYSFYEWGPWLSSYPLWPWELVRYLFGYSVFPYQVMTIFSHIFLGVGVYFLVRYLSKNQYVGLITAFFVVATPISFEAFQWLTQPMNFAWQGFFVCLSLMALVWELERGKSRKIPYLSAFLMMAAFGAGIARIGFVLPVISGVTFLIFLKYFRFDRLKSWAKNLFATQWIFYLMAFVFFATRGLLDVRGTKAEVVTAPLYRIYLYVVGVSIFPIDFFAGLSRASRSSIPVGVLTVWAGFIFLATLIIIFLIMKFFGKKVPIVLSIGVLWLMFSSLFYTLFAPHLPATDYQINYSDKTHHLSYFTSIGSLMVWGFLYYKVFNFLWGFRKPFGYLSAGALAIAVVVLNYNLLSKQYDIFLDFPKGVKMPRQQFFFDSYRKYIPEDTKKVNIFYDDGALKRKDNYKPNEYYYWAFWDKNKVKIFRGDEELKNYLTGLNDSNFRDREINSLYYIYTGYDDGLIEDNLSSTLRDSIYNPKLRNISRYGWELYWGKKGGNLFLPEIVEDRNTNVSYFKNPVLLIDRLSFPSILTPRLNIHLYIQKIEIKKDYVDLRAGILAQILNSWTLPSNDQTSSLVRYYYDNPSQGVLAFNDLLNSVHVNDKMVCGQKTNDDGIAFLVAWLGEPDSYYLGKRDRELLSGYLDRYYSICYFSNLVGYKNMNIELPNLGSILRRVVIIPLTKQPVSIEMLDSNLSTPEFLNN